MSDFNLLVSHYFSAVVMRDILQRVNFDGLVAGTSVDELAKILDVEPSRLTLALRFVASSSGLLELDPDGKWRLGSNHLNDPIGQFRMLKFLGAYGALSVKTIDRLRRDGDAPSFDLDDEAFANAYSRVSHLPLGYIGTEIARLPITTVVELGCGNAPILRDIAPKRDIVGLALDASQPMVDLAAACIHRDGLADRIDAKRATIEDVMCGATALPSSVDAICLRGVLNSMFSSTRLSASACLAGLSRRYPRAFIIVSDYYGRLSLEDCSARDRPTLCHDLLQLLSGQGVPPSCPRDWDAVYAAAGLDCIRRSVDSSLPGITQFVDVLSLADIG